MATVVWYSNPTSGNAMNWTDSNQWNQATDGSGTAGNPDSTDDKAIIQAGDTVTLDANVTTGGCSNLGTLTGNASYSLTLAGNDQDNNYNNAGTVTNLNLIMTGIRASGDRTVVDVGSGIRDFTLNDTTNSGNNVHALGNNLSIAGDLTITSGTLNTQFSSTDRSLTVAGTTDVDGTLTCNDSTIVCTGNVHGAGTINFMTSDFTANDNLGCQNLNVGTAAIDTADQFGSTSDDGGATIIATGAASISCKRFHAKACTPSTMTVTLDGSTHTSAVNMLAGTLHHLTVNSSGTKTLITNTTVGGKLTITAGTLDTGSDRNLTVTGDVSITGTLTGNASAITIGKMLEITNGGTYAETSGTTLISGQPDGDYVLRNHDGGTYTKHATGILKIARTSASGTKYAKFGEDVYNDVILENTSSGSVVAIVGVMNLAGDLTVVEGELRSYGGTGAIDVDGDVSIEDGGKFSTETSQLAAGGVNADFGSLTIASGGTYDATPLTTTITSEKDHSGQGYGWRNDGGTFTHNKGLVKFDTPANTIIKENTWYDFELYADGSSRQYEIRDVSGNEITFLGNLTLTAGRLKTTTSSDTITVHGNTHITSSAKCWHNAHQDTNKITHHGLVTNFGEFKINDGTTVKLNGGIRNMGTITVA